MKHLLLCLLITALAASGSELRFALHDEPKTLDPLMTSNDSEETIRYLTEGVLIRINRLTQKPEGELAASWKISKDSKTILFQLRQQVTFPDGSPFTSEDVVETFRKLLDPALHSPIADSFQTEKGVVKMNATGRYAVVAEFPVPTGGLERMFDTVAIVSAKATHRPAPGLGPFLIAAQRPGAGILLKRNPTYWKRDDKKRQLPRISSIRLDIEQNRDLELLRFRRGELQLIDKLTPEFYDRLNAETPGVAVDAGPTLESEFLWFNEAPQSPLPGPTKAWFQSKAFRRAVSKAIERADLCRVVYRGHASPASGPVSPANKLWLKEGMVPEPYDPAGALKLLATDGFRMQGDSLHDAHGNAVKFSIVTNAGSKTRERMAAMIQQDLAKIGIKISIVTLDFPSLIERMTRTLNYEACILGLVNVDPDPSGLMNVLLSSASNHPWNPSEKKPATAWESEIDRLMLAQASTADFKARKKSFDHVQEILREQTPIVYLLHPNALSSVSPQLAGVKTSPFFPHSFWDLEHVTFTGPGGAGAAGSGK
jgi:peptide/nickel transport system substrate-binding protein